MSQTERTTGTQVQLMMTCLCDTFFDSVAQATVEVLEHVGCNVEVPEAQTCCGQPAFNSGDWDSTRKVVRHTCKTFDARKPTILPSGSCAHMVAHGYDLAFEKEDDLGEVQTFSKSVWELCDFLVNGLGVERWPGRFDAKISLHRSCHTRGTQTYQSAVKLLSSIEGVELVEFDESEQCCGFGGTFSVAYPNTSVSMGKLKIEMLTASKPDIVGAVDMACMMHLSGIAQKQGRPLNKLHVAEILMKALRNGQKQ
ncbi:(Fe-S)-binding protein [Pelagicoccus sp. NFK12]|uniref:(Fe-S)-binding protein n=1 Tax=Pelagicoccus enzymogenes TaxID=2773457 RepID=A0A927FB99_9BACT|nr:(Fe-S)-binding protein [Pelagicoccus enzymogenes]MBD5781922.1 (Fe-S)-binding protein [Pelagicoccus enzymogenes]MDQ8196680.1 (Fe-S)-binding protein [Pelagicoccus enzymogenes]